MLRSRNRARPRRVRVLTERSTVRSSGKANRQVKSHRSYRSHPFAWPPAPNYSKTRTKQKPPPS